MKKLAKLLLILFAVSFEAGASIKELKTRYINGQTYINVRPENKKSLRDSYDRNFYWGFGNVVSGKTAVANFHWTTEPNVYSQTVTVTLSGSNQMAVTSDACTGATLLYAAPCDVSLTYAPTNKDTVYGVIKFTWISTYEDGRTLSGVYTHYISGNSLDKPGLCEPKAQASIIGVTSQTLGEVVDIVGAPFNLSYTSAFSPQYSTTTAQFQSQFGFNLEGWTISLNHQYNKDQRRLYLGSGSAVARDYILLDNDNLMVTSIDGQEVYIFTSAGKHLETRTFLTGALKFTFSYDTNDRLIQVKDAYQKATQILRNTNGLISSIIAPFGQTTNFTTNSIGLFASVTNPSNESYFFTYKPGTGLLQTFTKPGGQASTFTYNTNGKLTKDVGHGGNFWELIAQTGGVIKASQMGRQTSYFSSYDVNGNLNSTQTDPTGYAVTSTETLSGSSSTNYGFKQEESYTADDIRFGSVHKRSSGSKTTVNGSDLYTSVTQRIQYPDGATPTPFNYSKLTNISNMGTIYSTDVFDNSTKTRISTSTQGVVSTIKYDDYEKPISIKLGSDVAQTFAYNNLGQLAFTAQGPKNQTSFEYNNQGLLKSVTNGRSESTRYFYDLAGRRTSTIFSDGRAVQFGYDANGNMTSLTPPGKPTHYFEFNAMELSSKYLPPALSGVTSKDTLYSYNLDKQLTMVTKPNGDTVNYNYNATSGLLQTITSNVASSGHTLTYLPNSYLLAERKNSFNHKQKYTYHGDRFKSEEFATNTDLTVGKVTYTYDWQNRVNSKTISGRASNDSDAAYINFNNDNQPIQYGQMVLTYSPKSGRLGTTVLGAVKDSYSYDQYGALSKYDALVSGSSVYSYQLVRDNMSRIIGLTETTFGVTKKFSYTYDFAGRLTDVLQDGVSVASFTYDLNGNRTNTILNGTSYPSSFDDQDRMLNFGSQSYYYNANGAMNQSVSSIGAVSNFGYDGHGNLNLVNLPGELYSGMYYDSENRMINKTRLLRTSAGRLVYDDQNRIVGSFSSAGVTEAVYHYPTGSHSPDYMKVANNYYRIIKNHLGSPILIVNINDGSVIQQLAYNVLGKAVVNTNPYFQPFGFAGGFYDHDTKLVKFGRRDYDTETGRWLSKDPIHFRAGDTNLYGYVWNDPINLVDPSGLAPGDVFPSINAAGADAINYINDISIKGNVEYAGSIYRTTGGYSYTAPNPGTESTSSVASCPDRVGTYHTHGGYSPEYDNEHYSPADRTNAAARGVPSYLGTPSGRTLVMSPTGAVLSVGSPTGGMSSSSGNGGFPAGVHSP